MIKASHLLLWLFKVILVPFYKALSGNSVLLQKDTEPRTFISDFIMEDTRMYSTRFMHKDQKLSNILSPLNLHPYFFHINRTYSAPKQIKKAYEKR